MSNSSQPKNSLDSLLNDTMISIGATGASGDTITIISDSNTGYSYNSTYDYGAVTLTTNAGAGQSVFTIDSSAGYSDIQFNFPEEWIDSFPEWDRVQDMCKKYPGLKIAYENFRVFYEMVKDDYDNPTPKK